MTLEGNVLVREDCDSIQMVKNVLVSKPWSFNNEVTETLDLLGPSLKCLK